MPRGKGKVLARAHINLRVSEKTLAYFKQHPNYTALMRSVLEGYVEEQIKEGAQGSKIPAPTAQPTSHTRRELVSSLFAALETNEENEMSEEEEGVDTAYRIATEEHNFFGTFEEYKKNVWELLKSTYIDTSNKNFSEVDWRTLPWPPKENKDE